MRSLDMLQKVNVQQCGGWGGSSLNCKCPIPQNAAFRLLILEQLPEAKVCLNGRENKYKEKKTGVGKKRLPAVGAHIYFQCFIT